MLIVDCIVAMSSPMIRMLLLLLSGLLTYSPVSSDDEYTGTVLQADSGLSVNQRVQNVDACNWWHLHCIWLWHACLNAYFASFFAWSLTFLAVRTNGRAYATVLRPSSSVCDICTVAKRCVLEQKLLLIHLSHMIYRFVPKWMTLTFV